MSLGVLLILAGCAAPPHAEGRLIPVDPPTRKTPEVASLNQAALPFTIGEPQQVDWGRVKADLVIVECMGTVVLDLRVSIPGFGSIDTYPINAWLFHDDGEVTTFSPSNQEIDTWVGCLCRCEGSVTLDLPKRGEVAGLLIQVGEHMRYLTRK